jgi:hypothetical protein
MSQPLSLEDLVGELKEKIAANPEWLSAQKVDTSVQAAFEKGFDEAKSANKSMSQSLHDLDS